MWQLLANSSEVQGVLLKLLATGRAAPCHWGHSRAGLCWPLHPACENGAGIPQPSALGSSGCAQKLIAQQSFNSCSCFPLNPPHQHRSAGCPADNPCSALRGAANPFQQAVPSAHKGPQPCPPAQHHGGIHTLAKGM